MPERLTARLLGGNGAAIVVGECKEETGSVAIIHKKGRSV